MNQYNEISTPQYMGSKTRVISHICEPIIKNKSIKTVVDLFAGTGSIGYHIHMLVEIPPSISVSSFVGYLKGKRILTRSRVSQ